MSDENPATSSPERERATILKVYGFLCLMLVFSCIPGIFFFILSLLMFTAMLPVARHIKGKAPPDSLTADHMDYLIRTIGVFTVIALALLAAITFYIWSVYDTAPLQPCMDTLANTLQAGESPNAQILMPCVGPFMQANRALFLKAALVVGIPAVGYLLLKVGRGLARARRGERINATE